MVFPGAWRDLVGQIDLGCGLVLIREAGPGDFGAITEIYGFYVQRSLATFEEVSPSVEELLARRAEVVGAGLPYLVAEEQQEIYGFAYASLYRTRSAYRHTVENTVYVAPGRHGRGIGGALLSGLIERCSAGQWRQMVAVIGDSGNAASLALHRRLGFRHVGTLEAVGYKFGRWVDTVVMQRGL